MRAVFRWKESGRQWFSNIDRKGPFRTSFDLYYLCLMIGLAANKKGPIEGLSDMTDDFVGEYKGRYRYIIGLLLSAEIRSRGLTLIDKAQVRGVLRDIIDTDKSTKLTAQGIDALNAYSSGGYDYLEEKIIQKPHSPPEFLVRYYQLLKEAIAQDEGQQSGVGH